ncbi:MAG: PfkB family carbohydrate kinase [Lachnospiraceae bacterium]|jgi:sugar/nucleoside kinase (ribokinase family)|nr:PfkB family carbohydrate kinase [Lachnospiraceae bacterium]MCH4063131.1 PfkB family carbohydrate kinase [Lachnospiraceae bacterium]MCH4104439.1 PfkB family carbohydrate kinase [Lachnospiraceae bacterium]MCI1308412.1 PfkB family carbohydrate kinase [Lachnospiraceae bacterium]MCI1333190.1 PfkB family carbohydrate kinase [Lachnospiraceae bacterium]
MDIIALGMTVMDLIVQNATPELFERDSTPVNITSVPGGDALNVAVNAAALGRGTALVSSIGDDPNGIYLQNFLRDHYVNTSALKICVDGIDADAPVKTEDDNSWMDTGSLAEDVRAIMAGTYSDAAGTGEGADASAKEQEAASAGPEDESRFVAMEEAGDRSFSDIAEPPAGDAGHAGERKKYETAVSLVMVEPSGERHFLSSTDIFDTITPRMVTDQMLRSSKFLSLNSFYRMRQMDAAGVVPLFRRAHECGCTTVMDTMPCRTAFPLQQIAPVLNVTDIFLPSIDEAAQITGTRDLQKIKIILSRFGIKMLGIKLGTQGSFVTDFANDYMIPAYVPDKIVSTTGAGDTYVAGFMTGLAEGMSMREAATFASAAASFTVEVPGASGGVTSVDQVMDRVRNGKTMFR